jgi:hypothetical protein
LLHNHHHHHHHHLSSGAGTIGQTVATVPSGLSQSHPMNLAAVKASDLVIIRVKHGNIWLDNRIVAHSLLYLDLVIYRCFIQTTASNISQIVRNMWQRKYFSFKMDLQYVTVSQLLVGAFATFRHSWDICRMFAIHLFTMNIVLSYCGPNGDHCMIPAKERVLAFLIFIICFSFRI